MKNVLAGSVLLAALSSCNPDKGPDDEADYYDDSASGTPNYDAQNPDISECESLSAFETIDCAIDNHRELIGLIETDAKSNLVIAWRDNASPGEIGDCESSGQVYRNGFLDSNTNAYHSSFVADSCTDNEGFVMDGTWYTETLDGDWPAYREMAYQGYGSSQMMDSNYDYQITDENGKPQIRLIESGNYATYAIDTFNSLILYYVESESSYSGTLTITDPAYKITYETIEPVFIKQTIYSDYTGDLDLVSGKRKFTDDQGNSLVVRFDSYGTYYSLNDGGEVHVENP